MTEDLNRLSLEVDALENFLIEGRLDQAKLEEIYDDRLQKLEIGLIEVGSMEADLVKIL